MKRQKKLISLIAILAVVVAAYFAVSHFTDDGIGGNVNLLEKNTAPNGDEKADHLCGNTALGQVDLPFFQSSHGSSLYLFQIKKRP